MKNKTIVLTWTGLGLVLALSFLSASCALEPRSESLSLFIKAPKAGLSGGIRYLLVDADKWSPVYGDVNFLHPYIPIDLAHYPNDNPRLILGTTLDYNEQLGGYPIIIEGIEPGRRLRIFLHAFGSSSPYYYYYYDGAVTYTWITDYNAINSDVTPLASRNAFEVQAGQMTTVICEPWTEPM